MEGKLMFLCIILAIAIGMESCFCGGNIIIPDLWYFVLNFSLIPCRISKEEVLLELEVLQLPSVMMKMPYQYLAQSQVLEVGKGQLVHLKLQPEEGAGEEAEVPALWSRQLLMEL